MISLTNKLKNLYVARSVLYYFSQLVKFLARVMWPKIRVIEVLSGYPPVKIP